MMLQKNTYPNVVYSHAWLQHATLALQRMLQEKPEFVTAIIEDVMPRQNILCHRIHEQLSFEDSFSLFNTSDCYGVIYKIAQTLSSPEPNQPQRPFYQEKKRQ